MDKAPESIEIVHQQIKKSRIYPINEEYDLNIEIYNDEKIKLILIIKSGISLFEYTTEDEYQNFITQFALKNIYNNSDDLFTDIKIQNNYIFDDIEGKKIKINDKIIKLKKQIKIEIASILINEDYNLNNKISNLQNEFLKLISEKENIKENFKKFEKETNEKIKYLENKYNMEISELGKKTDEKIKYLENQNNMEISELEKKNDEKIKYLENKYNMEISELKKKNNELNGNVSYLNKINGIEFDLIYTNNDIDKGEEQQIIGNEFSIEKENIKIIINGEIKEFNKKYKLKEGDNYVKLIFKTPLKSLANMFSGCKTLTNIDDLKYLKVRNYLNLSGMFKNCSSLTNIDVLSYWDVSNVKNLDGMFSGCSLLLNIRSLQNWNLSNCEDLSNIFYGCKSLNDISPLKNWNISNVKRLLNSFRECEELSDIRSLSYWNTSNVEDLSNFFRGCKNLQIIEPLKKWDISKCINLQDTFSECKINDISPLSRWDVSNCKDFSYMFYEGNNFTNVSQLNKWNVSKSENFMFMFGKCLKLSNIEGLNKWNVKQCEKFSGMFSSCPLLVDISPLKDWDISNGKDFTGMFSGCHISTIPKKIIKWKEKFLKKNLNPEAFKGMFD